MATTDTSEKGLESLIVAGLTDNKWRTGTPGDFDRDHAIDLVKLLEFLQTTQPVIFEQLGIAADGPKRLKFLARLQGEIAKRGVADVLRRGVKDGPVTV